VWEKDDELRKEGGGVGENGGLLMRGKGCWRLGGSVTEISKTREAAGGWLRLEDEGMKKRWKGRGAGVFFGRLRGRRKTKGKKLDSGRRDCWCCGLKIERKWQGQDLFDRLREERGLSARMLEKMALGGGSFRF
jgi:hypothetical protein